LITGGTGDREDIDGRQSGATPIGSAETQGIDPKATRIPKTQRRSLLFMVVFWKVGYPESHS
jgi:hypothetical protein